MNTQEYQQLLQDLSEVASEITEPPCNFEEEPEVFDFSDAAFNDMWSDR
jgi:hypothetical protein